MMNTAKTVVLMAALTGLLVYCGSVFGGKNGAVTAFVLAAVMNLAAYWFSDKLVLLQYRAQEVDEGAAPTLYRVVRRLTQGAGLPMPKVYVIPTDSPNAFATGRNPSHAAVAATEGLLRLLNEHELEGVMAHELSHVKHRDILIGSIVATFVGAIMLLRQLAWFAQFFGGGRDEEDSGGMGGALGFLILFIVAPLAAIILQLTISRSREYAADAGGGALSHKPLALASALEKLHEMSRYRPLPANPNSAHMFIVNPLSAGGVVSLFSTHPSVENRIARLREQAAQMGQLAVRSV